MSILIYYKAHVPVIDFTSVMFLCFLSAVGTVKFLDIFFSNWVIGRTCDVTQLTAEDKHLFILRAFSRLYVLNLVIIVSGPISNFYMQRLAPFYSAQSQRLDFSLCKLCNLKR